MQRFEMNGNSYLTDRETVELLKEIMPGSDDVSAVAAVMALGLKTGRIIEENQNRAGEIRQILEEN